MVGQPMTKPDMAEYTEAKMQILSGINEVPFRANKGRSEEGREIQSRLPDHGARRNEIREIQG
jgi:hypothetical protein